LTDAKYIFFISTLYKESQNLVTNEFRAAFIRACKNSGIQFDGGLLAAQQNNEFTVFNDVITFKYVKSDQYLRKTQKSAVVFNTPSIWGCLGWKLGEFFAMGKAIISTPLGNEMPVELIHGEQIHFVESETEIENAVQRIITDHNYRRKLEKGAREYFDKYLAPEIVVKRLTESLN
jgi:glycosyltransferase involved in cell wall biosynthesis